MFELLYLNLNKESRSTPPRNTMLHKILDYLYKHYTEDISLEQIAATCHYSASYVRHIFKKETGYTISHYLNILKITKAKELLTTTALPVSRDLLACRVQRPELFQQYLPQRNLPFPQTVENALFCKIASSVQVRIF